MNILSRVEAVMSLCTPPKKNTRALAGLAIAAAVSSTRAQTSTELTPALDVLCTPGGKCLEVVEIPEAYGLSSSCGGLSDLTTGIDVVEWNPKWSAGEMSGTHSVLMNSGKRFKDGVFNIEKIEQKGWYDWTDAGTNGWNYFRGGKITYTVKCSNGIKYRDVYEWNQSQEFDINTEIPGDGVDHFCQYFPQIAAGIPGHSCSGADEYPNIYEPVALMPFHPDPGPYGSWQSRIIAPIGSYSSDLLLPIGRIANIWMGREVGLPRYFGGVNKLAVPIVMINGLGYDYRVWGAVPSGPQGTEAWRKGEVTDYVGGSLPDVISRAYGLAKGGNVNRNGIYFLNVAPNATLDGIQEKTYLIDRFNSILQDYTGGTTVPASFKVDVVCHGSGCIMLRAALDAANAYPAFVTGKPQDHIRRIISVNAPNLGTGLAKSPEDMAGFAEYNGLPELLAEAGNDDPNEVVMSGVYEIDLSTLGWNNCGDWDWACWVGGQAADIGIDALGFAMDGDFARIPITLKGGLFGPHVLATPYGVVQSSNNGALQSMRGNLEALHSGAAEIQRGLLAINSLDYPKNSSGAYIDYTPFYSDRTDWVESGIAKEISDGAFSSLCGTNTPNCDDLSRVLTQVGREKLEAAINNVNTSDGLELQVSEPFRAMLAALKTGWLAHSDLVVEKASQVWSLEVGGTGPTGSPAPQLHKAMTYGFHYASVPEGHPNHAVIHASMAGLSGASQPSDNLAFLDKGAAMMGLDLFCGLDDGCRELTSSNRSPVYMGPSVQTIMPQPASDGTLAGRMMYTQSVALSGDFQVYPQILSPNSAGVAVQNASGQNIAIAGYNPSVGTWVWNLGDGTSARVLLPPDHRTQISIERVGSTLTFVLRTQDGKRTRAAATNMVTGTSVNVVAVGDGLATNPAYLVGPATFTNPSSVKPMVAWGKLRPVVMEKSPHMAQQSSPWMWVGNRTNEVQRNLKVTYFFTADPGRKPKVEMDNPRDLAIVERNIDGELWAFTVLIPEVSAQTLFPKGGMHFRLHYEDWTPWNRSDDPSRGVSVPLVADKVLIQDGEDRLVWGDPALAQRLASSASSVVPPPPGAVQVAVTWQDPGEANMIRPNLTIRNTGTYGTLLPGFKVSIWLTGLGTRTDVPVLEKWWDPNATGSITRETDGRVRLDLVFAYSVAAGQQAQLGAWGVHWPNDYASFDKSTIRAAVELRDASGAVLSSGNF